MDQNIPLLHDDKTKLRKEQDQSRSQAGQSSEELKTRLKQDGQPAESSADNGLVVASYTTLRRIGEGGFSTVYQARDAAGHDVAIKVLNENFVDSREILERFRRAAAIVEKFDHPNIVHVLGLVDVGGRPGLVMEFVQGKTLEQVIQEKSALGVDQAVNIAVQMCDALAYAHERGVIHRDVKPSNILLLPKGSDSQEKWVAKLTDFDIAKIVTETGFTRSRIQMGTPYFVAPEQWQGKHDIDGRADVFSLGVVLYYMLTGTVPQGRFGHPSDTNPGIPRRVGSVILKAVALNRDIRYPDMAELKKALVGDKMTKATRDIPFEFQSGPPAHSIYDLVERCDSDWATGLQHLKDGDILIWLKRVKPELVPCVQKAVATKGNRDEGLEEALHCMDPALPWPVLETEPLSVSFGELAPGERRSKTITIHNPSRGFLSGKVGKMPEWLQVKGKVFHCHTGGSQKLVLVAKAPSKPSFGPVEGELRIESNGGKATIPLSMTVANRLLIRSDFSVSTLLELCHVARQEWIRIRRLLYDGSISDWLRESRLHFKIANEAKKIMTTEDDRDAGLFHFLQEHCPQPESCLPAKLDTKTSTVDLGKGRGKLPPVRIRVRNTGGNTLQNLAVSDRSPWIRADIIKTGDHQAIVEVLGSGRHLSPGVRQGFVKLSVPDSPVPAWGNTTIDVNMEVLPSFPKWLVFVIILLAVAGVAMGFVIDWRISLSITGALIVSVLTVFSLLS